MEKQEQDYVFGANIIESLTTGMYQDSKVIYREYIQNACDQIDKAVAEELLQANEGKIEIWLEPQSNRTVVIRDNATGIPEGDFRRALGNIADSDKKIGKDKGFRGIGRLCGLAYCEELVFESKAKGESIISIMRCNAKEMRDLITEHNRGNKQEADSVLKKVFHFERKKDGEIDDHYFQVSLKNINEENMDLLDAREIEAYLSFVAPVPYQNIFPFRKKIRDHAQSKGSKIDEYCVKLDGKQIFKGYTDRIKEQYEPEEIFNIAFKDLFDKDGNLLAWLWVGISKFRGALPKNTPMRSIRLRKHNIQIGNEDTLQRFFVEDRGHSYFVGEIFAVASELIPNSQRDYFNENPTRQEFQNLLKEFFRDELQRIYKSASMVNSGIKNVNTYEKKKTEFISKEKLGKFVSKEQKNDEHAYLEELREKAEKAQKDIEKIEKQITEMEDRFSGQVISLVIEKTRLDSKIKPTALPQEKTFQKKRTDKLSGKFNSKELQIIERIFEIIHSSIIDTKTADKLVDDIMKGLVKGLKK
jgi:molecular chaperone HtpG